MVTLFFGIIHGLGFSNYFKAILPGSASDKLVPLLEFALGIEAAQLIVVFVVLMISYISTDVFPLFKTRLDPCNVCFCDRSGVADDSGKRNLEPIKMKEKKEIEIR